MIGLLLAGCGVLIMARFAAGAEIPPELERVLAAQSDPVGWIQSADLRIDRESRGDSGWTLTERYRWRRSDHCDEIEHNVLRTSDQGSSRSLWSRRGAVLRYYEEQETEGQSLWQRGDIFPVMFPEELPFRMDVQLVIYPLGRPNREVIQAASDLCIVGQDSSGMTIEFQHSTTREKIRFHFLASEGYSIDAATSVKDDGKSLPLRVQVDEFQTFDAGRLPRRVRAFRGDREIARWHVAGRINEADIEPPVALEFPRGTQVDDHISNEYHIWGQGKPDATFQSDQQRRAWVRQRLKPSANAPPPPRRFLFWANLVLFSLLGLIYLLRFWIQRKPVE